MNTGLSLLYILVGSFLTLWTEKILVNQGYMNDLGLAFSFGERIKRTLLWPVFLFEYLVAFINPTLKNVR